MTVIWYLMVLAIGLGKSCNVSVGKAALWIFGLWYGLWGAWILSGVGG